ncbi:MAG: fibronectin type III domain-containing protein [Candidatus Kerfeldbacteria bacterium]|nr:fibronectin type III domain-containing protein [Candidatus Kerfeldbacteria bacterium]
MRRSRIIHGFIVLRQFVYAHIIDSEQAIVHAHFPLHRLFLSIELFFLYVIYACCFSLAVLVLSPAQSFEYFHQPSSKSGYTYSYTHHRSWSRGLRLSGIATTFVLVGATFVNAMVFTQQETRAVNDDRILSVDFSASSYLPRNADNAPVTYTVDFVTAEELRQEDTIWFYLLPEGNTNPTASGIDLTNVTVDFGIMEGAEFIPEQNGTVGHIHISNSIPAGPVRLVISGVLNPGDEGNYVAAISTSPVVSIDMDYMASAVFEITDGIDCSTKTIDGLTANVFGTNIAVEWDAVNSATTYTLSWWKSVDETTVETISVFPETEYLITNLDTNMEYIVQVIAATAVCETEAQSSTTVTTDAQRISEQQYTRPHVPKKKIMARRATIRWNSDDFVSAYILQIKKKNGKLFRRLRNIPNTTTASIVRNMRPQHTYTVQLRAHYINDELTKFSEPVTLTTKKKQRKK